MQRIAQSNEQALLPLLGGENAHATACLQDGCELRWSRPVGCCSPGPCTSIAQVGPALVDALPASEWEVEQFQVGRAGLPRLAELLVGSGLRVTACCCCASYSREAGVAWLAGCTPQHIAAWLPTPACPQFHYSLSEKPHIQNDTITSGVPAAGAWRWGWAGLCLKSRLGKLHSQLLYPRSPHHCAALPPAPLDPQSTTGYGTTTS